MTRITVEKLKEGEENGEIKIFCAYCGERKAWPSEFFIPHYAKCSSCLEKEKLESMGNRILQLLSKMMLLVKIMKLITNPFKNIKFKW